MARIHGRNGRLYMNVTSGGTAAAVAFITQWSITFSTDKVDVTALGDTNKVYVAGLPDAQGTYSGWFDTSTAQMFTAAQDGVARTFFLYPDTPNAAGPYWTGTAIFDFQVSTGVTDAASISGSFAAASAVSKVG